MYCWFFFCCLLPFFLEGFPENRNGRVAAKRTKCSKILRSTANKYTQIGRIQLNRKFIIIFVECLPYVPIRFQHVLSFKPTHTLPIPIRWITFARLEIFFGRSLRQICQQLFSHQPAWGFSLSLILCGRATSIVLGNQSDIFVRFAVWSWWSDVPYYIEPGLQHRRYEQSK